MRGVILAGGTGSRLWPLTLSVNKHLLPVYDKPLIFYPISTLMLAGVREILIVTRPEDLEDFQETLGSGEQWGVTFSFLTQDSPRGIADALVVGASFLEGSPFVLMLGDNILHGPALGESLRGRQSEEFATIFAYEVSDVRSYACIEVDSAANPVSIEEKPTNPRSSLAVPGLYFFPSEALEVSRTLLPSPRGELEITDVNVWFLDRGRLRVIELPRGTAWLDAGTQEDLIDASNYVRVLQERQGGLIASPEEIAVRSGWRTRDEVVRSLEHRKVESGYFRRLITTLSEMA